MIDLIAVYICQLVSLLFGICTTLLFLSIPFDKRTFKTIAVLFAIVAFFDIISSLHLGIAGSALVHPLIVHIPVIIVVYLGFKKPLLSVIASMSTSYMLCAPGKWFGLLFTVLSGNNAVGSYTQACVSIIIGIVCFKHVGIFITSILEKSNVAVGTFAIVPLVYYIFDYVMSVVFPVKSLSNNLALEFVTFFLCIVFTAACAIYHAEYQRRFEAERKIQIISTTSQQQKKELDLIKQSIYEARLLRHDMRLLLESIALCINKSDDAAALDLISKYTEKIQASTYIRYCNNDTFNYILSKYQARCEESNINLNMSIEIDEIEIDELDFASVISNAFDNAINAQKSLPSGKREIHVLLKQSNDKILFSIKNRIKNIPLFKDGYPTSSEKGHGYGTQSIRYVTEKLGGRYQFSIEEDMFILRIII